MPTATVPLPGSDAWQRWTHRLGYSAKVGDLRSDVAPEINPASGLLEWHAIVWHRSDRSAVLFEAWGYPRDVGTDALTFMETNDV